MLSNYRPIEYLPRDSEGTIELGPSSYKDGPGLVRSIQADLETGSVMVAGSCGYMLAPLLASLRAQGIPFANPWRTKRGDWNPLGTKRGTSTSSRIGSFLRRPANGRVWSKGDLRDWVDTLRAGDSLIRGAKKALAMIDENEEHHDVDNDLLAAVFKEDVLVDLLFEAYPDPDKLLAWLEPRMMPEKLRKAKFAIEVARKHGYRTLEKEPRLFVGTIHSFKGAEADTVYLMPDMSPSGVAEYNSGQAFHRNNMVRTFYVGLTRAREKLVICSPAGPAVKFN